MLEILVQAYTQAGSTFAGAPGDVETAETAEGEEPEPKPKGRKRKEKDEREKEDDPWENYGLNEDGTEIVEELAPNEVRTSALHSASLLVHIKCCTAKDIVGYKA